MKDKLLAFSDKHDFTQVSKNIKNITLNTTLKIGFLGEFSSGKSTLINSMLGGNILPAMDRPTTKSVTLIEPKDGVDQNLYFKVENDTRTEIDIIDFEDMATGRIEGKTLIQTPVTKVLQEGTLIVDTPGISSIHKTDTDITFGYLPFLDGAVICLTVDKGTLPESMRTFLSKNEIKPLVKYFVFALTFSDFKSVNAAQKIRTEVIKELRIFNDTYNLGVGNLEERVVLTSSKNSPEGINDFMHTFEKCFVQNKAELSKERVKKELLKEAENLLCLAQDKYSNFQLSDKELNEKEQNILFDKKNFEKLKDAEKNKLETMRKDLKKKLLSKTESYLSSLNQVNESNLDETIGELADDINTLSQKTVSKYFDSMDLPHIDGQLNVLKNSIRTTLKRSNGGKTLVTAAIMAAILGGASLAANTAEAAASTVIKTTADKVANDKIVLNNKNTKAVLTEGAKLIKEINPVEHLGDFISGKVIANQSHKFLISFCEEISNELHDAVEDYLKLDLFKSYDNRIEDLKTSIASVRDKKNLAYKQNKTYLLELESDIKSLKTITS